jgi:hypothetical protein
MTVSVPLPSLTERFAAIVARAVQGIGDLLERWPSLDRSRVVPLGLVLLTRTWLIERRDAVTDLIAAFRAGTLKPPQPARPRAPPQGPPPPRRPQPQRAPTRFGWFREMGADIGDAGEQLAAWLSEAEMKALAAATPKAGRLLRPMLRMLGREIPEWLRLPPRPKPPEPEPFRPLDKRYNSVRRWKHHTVAPQEMPPPPAPPPSPPPNPPAAAAPPPGPPPNPPPSPPTERPRIRWAFVDMSR